MRHNGLQFNTITNVIFARKRNTRGRSFGSLRRRTNFGFHFGLWFGPLLGHRVRRQTYCELPLEFFGRVQLLLFHFLYFGPLNFPDSPLNFQQLASPRPFHGMYRFWHFEFQRRSPSTALRRSRGPTLQNAGGKATARTKWYG